jgi:hypothetical protein
VILSSAKDSNLLGCYLVGLLVVTDVSEKRIAVTSGWPNNDKESSHEGAVTNDKTELRHSPKRF